MIEEHGAGYIMHKRKIEEVAEAVQRELNQVKRRKKAETVVLREWQEKAVEKLLAQDNRKILWIVDEKGNNGKTFLASYLADKYGARIFENGKSADIKYMWKGEDIVVFDLVRSCQDKINFAAIELLKNGRFNSTKYVCAEKSIDTDKHVKMICFTNEEPDRTKLSPDRWDVMRLLELEEFDLTESRAEYRARKKKDKEEYTKYLEERWEQIQEEIQDQDYVQMFNEK